VKKLLNFRSNRFSKGLTLIELLVVVAILGILAAILLAAVDPIEQQLKATDAVARNTSAEWVQAANRYFGGKQGFPWYGAPNGVSCIGNAAATKIDPAVSLTTIDGDANTAGTCLNALVSTGELKASFGNIDKSITDKITVYQKTGTTQVIACYAPQSKAGKADTVSAVYNPDGTACTPNGAGNCYYCAF